VSITLYELWTFLKPILRPYKKRLIALIIFPIIWCLVETIAPFLIKLIIDHLAVTSGIDPQTGKMLLYIVLIYSFLMLVLEISTRSCNYIWLKTFPKIRADIQTTVLASIQNHSYQFFYNQLTGDLISRYRNLAYSFESIFRSLLYGFYPTALAFIFSLLFIVFINHFFAMVFLSWFLAMTIITILFFKKSVLASQQSAHSQNLIMGYVNDFLSNAIMMVAYPRNLSQDEKFLKLKEASVGAAQESEFVTFKADILRSFFSWLLLAGMIIFLSIGWQRTWITLGDFSFIAAICFYMRRSIWMASSQLADFFKELGIAQEALSLIFTPLNHTRVTSEKPKDLPKQSKNTIDFSQICFGYSTKGKMLFNNLNLQIPAGQKLGISGMSGAGKTSLIHLLLRLHDSYQGTIHINNEDYREFNLEDLRNLFSYVPQNALLLHQSIFDNIAFGKIAASPEKVYEAARVCLCDEFIQTLEKGYDTIVGEGGFKLSGGQRQRIAIARAYLKRAPIFILDEATSALDEKLEEKLLNQLCSSLKDHTIILISHRSSSLQKMDRVITFHQGQVIMDKLQDKSR
jgi:ATP-binding cassette subfamily B protein